MASDDAGVAVSAPEVVEPAVLPEPPEPPDPGPLPPPPPPGEPFFTVTPFLLVLAPWGLPPLEDEVPGDEGVGVAKDGPQCLFFACVPPCPRSQGVSGS